MSAVVAQIPGTQGVTEEQLKAVTPSRENRRITDGAYDESLAVTCINGTFVGRESDGIVAYKGIPFVGKQPTGELRWKAPVDYVADDGIFEAYHNAREACQIPETSEYSGEDCLYLNLWTVKDAKPSDKRPVMVWIHGGAFEMGGTAFPLFEMHDFMAENPDVIVVTVCYRLGALGFLHLSHLPDGADYPDAQNLGLLDQMAALKWVHENIAGFGGDPDNVTIWGESAGAISVSLLPLIKGSHEYFQKCIIQSGSPTITRSAEEAIACTTNLMAALGCTTVADLKKLDAKQLIEAQSILTLRVYPERDGKIVPLDPWADYAAGAAKDITLLDGCNAEEFRFFVGVMEPDGFKAWATQRAEKRLAVMTDEERSRIEGFCGDVEGEDYKPLSRLFDQSWWCAPLIHMAEIQTAAGGTVYVYFFTAEPAHGDELAIVFKHPEMAGDRVFDETFCETMRKIWVQFAKTGNPSLSADVSPDGKAKEWSAYDLQDRQVMVLDEFDIHPERESERHIVDWDRTYFLPKYYML